MAVNSINIKDEISKSVSEDDSTEDEEIQLKEALDISKVYSDSGAIFEIVPPTKSPVKNDENYQYENMLKNLSFDHLDDDENDDGLSGFERLKLQMNDISGDGGVLKKMVRPGVGGDLPPKSRVSFEYNAYIEGHDEPFDSSYLRNKPEKFSLHEHNIIPGLKIALNSMRDKEKSKFLISPEYAYGPRGCPPRIPENATILYDVTIIRYVDYAAAEAFEALEETDMSQIPFREKYAAAKSYHQKANAFFKEERLLKAKQYYKKALRIMEVNCSVADEEEEQLQQRFIFQMNSNLAQVCLERKEFPKACTHCQNCLDVHLDLTDDMKSKVFFRYAKAKTMLDDYRFARRFIESALRIKPNNPDILKLKEALCKREQKSKEREKLMCVNMFKTKTPDQAPQQFPEAQATVCSDEDLPINDLDMILYNISKTQEKVSAPVKEAIDNIIRVFCNDDTPGKEATLPQDLSEEDLAYVNAVANANDLIVDTFMAGNLRLTKLRKN